MVEPEDYVICRECGHQYGKIIHRHLKKHNMTLKDYKDKYPDGPIVSGDVMKRFQKTFKINRGFKSFMASIILPILPHCACGCGERVSKPENKYVCGHGSRKPELKKQRAAFLRNSDNYVICLECGKKLRRITNTHLKLHHMTVGEYHFKHPGKEIESKIVKAKVSDALKRAHSSGRMKAIRRYGIDNPMADPVVRQKHNKAVQKTNRPDWCQHQSESLKGRKVGGALKPEQISDKIKGMWNDPDTVYNSVSYRGALSIGQQRSWGRNGKRRERVALRGLYTPEIGGSMDKKTGICSECGNNKKDTVFHHLSYVDDIVIELCWSCHSRAHHGDLLHLIQWDDRPYKKWGILRERILSRDGYKCMLCGETKKLRVHHIDYNSNNNDPRNLVTLCCVCNSGIGNGGKRVYKKRTNWGRYLTMLMKGMKIV